MDDNAPVQDKVNTPADQAPDASENRAPETGGAPAPESEARAAGYAASTATAPTRPRGPSASAIVVGLVAILLAGLLIARETMSLRVDWSRLGPGAIVGIGVVLVVIGAIGLVRRQDHL